jgi:hypothetical protein
MEMLRSVLRGYIVRTGLVHSYIYWLASVLTVLSLWVVLLDN